MTTPTTSTQGETITANTRGRVWPALIGAVVFGTLLLLGSTIATWAWIPVWVFLVQRRYPVLPIFGASHKSQTTNCVDQ